MHNSGELHMNAIMRILKYLKFAPTKEILFTKYTDPQGINIYMNADWARAIDNTLGYFTFVGENLVTLRSKNKMLLHAQVRRQNSEECNLKYMKHYD